MKSSNEQQYVLISENDLLNLMRKSFTEGNESYKDLRESVVMRLFTTWSQQTKTLALSPETKQSVIQATGDKSIFLF
jgi:hypothetical protein